MIRNFIGRDDTDQQLPLLNSNENITYRLNDVELAFKIDNIIGVGELFVTSSRVIWIGAEKSYDIDANFIILHAINHDPNSYPKSCLYCQFDNEDGGDKNEDEDCDIPSEMYLAPSDVSQVQRMFDAFSEAAMANPDDLEEYDGNLIYNLDEVQLGSEQANALAHLESVFVEPEDTSKE